MSAMAPETMPTVRRCQRLSRSCTAPAERSPEISMRAISLRSSTGRSKRASVSRSDALKANGASPSGRPLRSSARTVPFSAAPVAARSTLTLSAPAALSAPVNARASGMPPATTVIGCSPTACASSFTKSAPWPRSMPSDSQTNSTFGLPGQKLRQRRQRLRRGRRLYGTGWICCSRTRAESAVSSEMSCGPSDSGMSATARRSSSARAMMSSAVRSRASQAAAAVQPSSIRIATGALVFVVASGGCQSGPAAAIMTSAASASRNSVSHHGVRAGVSSRGAISSKSRVGGKSSRRGRGGISRNSHHSTGSVSSPMSTSGSVKPSGNPPIMPAPWTAADACERAALCAVPAPMRACSASSSSLGGRSVR